LSQSCKVALIADQEDFLSGSDCGKEVLPFGKFTTELPGKVNGGIDFPLKVPLGLCYGRNDICKRNVVANDQDIHVARRCLGSPGN